MEYWNYDNCPSCGENWDGNECEVCGFADNLLDNEYESPEGNIVQCTEEEAFEQGYISICPTCCYHVITWWEKEDHGVCIECWHKQHRNSLTRLKKGGIIRS